VQVVRGVPRELRYSEDHQHYIPLCVPCHLRFDSSESA
jgi:hypothetical protein